MTEKHWLLLIALTIGSWCVAAPAMNASDSTLFEINSVLASVNGEAISLNDVMEISRSREFQAYAAFEGDRLNEEIRKIRRKAVDEIIDRKLVIAEYYKAPYRIENNLIEHELDQTAIRMGCRSRSELRKKLAANNIDFAKFRKDLEDRMIYIYMVQKWCSIDGEPTPREIYEYFQQHQSELSGVESYELAMLKLDNTRKDFHAVCQEVQAALATAPERFEEMVSRFNSDADGGWIGSVEPGKLRIEFAQALKTPVEKRLYGPIRLDDSVVWLKLLKHNKVVNISFAQLQSKITKIITDKRRAELINLQTNILRRDAIVKYFF